jgi:hypothetical protein
MASDGWPQSPLDAEYIGAGAVVVKRFSELLAISHDDWE